MLPVDIVVPLQQIRHTSEQNWSKKVALVTTYNISCLRAKVPLNRARRSRA